MDNYCHASRKDFRDAVVAARAAVEGWSNASAYNRGQILYRAAEMLQNRAAELVNEVARSAGGSGMGVPPVRAGKMPARRNRLATSPSHRRHDGCVASNQCAIQTEAVGSLDVTFPFCQQPEVVERVRHTSPV